MPCACIGIEPKLMPTVAEQFADMLAAAGIKRIYGIVGGSLNGLTDAIGKQGKIEWLHFGDGRISLRRANRRHRRSDHDGRSCSAGIVN